MLEALVDREVVAYDLSLGFLPSAYQQLAKVVNRNETHHVR